MKNKTLHLLIAFIIVCTTSINAQSSITIDASQLYTTLKFSDSQGSSLNADYSGIFTGGYNISYRYDTDFGLILKSGLGIRNGGANMLYDDMNYAWQLKYTNLNLGAGYLYKIDRFNPYFMLSGYYAYLLNGTQTLNNEHYSITNSESLNKSDFGLIIAPGVEFIISDYIKTYLEFNYLMGLKNIEPNESQNTKNVGYGLTLGLSFSITK